MNFFQKLKLNIPTEEPAPPKRKRGRPRKYPAALSQASTSEPKEEGVGTETTMAEPAIEKRGRGRPRKSATLQQQTRTEDTQKEGELTIDVYETDGELVIMSPVGGVRSEDLEVSIEDDMLIIRGQRPLPTPEERQKIVMQECYWGPFSRRFVLPVEVEGQIKASLERGILTIRIPKADKKKKKEIVVEEIEE